VGVLGAGGARPFGVHSLKVRNTLCEDPIAGPHGATSQKTAVYSSGLLTRIQTRMRSTSPTNHHVR
jgi:hypothetical protein